MAYLKHQLRWPWLYIKSFIDCNLFQMLWFVVARFLLTRASRGPSAIAELRVWFGSPVHRSHRWTDFNDLYVTRRVSTKGCAFWGLHCYCSPFRGQIAQKNNFGGVIKHFPFKRAKYSNFHVTKPASSIPTKFSSDDKDLQVLLVDGSKMRPTYPR